MSAIYKVRRSALMQSHQYEKPLIIPSDVTAASQKTVEAITSSSAKVIESARAFSDEHVRFSTGEKSDFFWLTGFNEPGWVLVLDARRNKEYLIYPEVDAVHTLFDGDVSIDEVKRVSGIQAVLTTAEYAKEHDTGGAEVAEGYRKHLAKLRAVKSPEEIETLKSAVATTMSAFERAKNQLTNAEGLVRTESQLEAEFIYTFRRQGAHHAYDPIVAGGKNALTLHYGKNADSLPENGLVLIDIGARVEGYNADITRTYAIGTPSNREHAVHAAVEKAHHEIIALIQPGVSLEAYQDRSDEIMKEALRGLDLLKTPEDYRKYFPHAVSHGLGVDVHESLGGYAVFTPGMVLTVEPGIYIPEEGIGVRIEDDILVTDDGNENLSAALSTSL